MKFPYPEGTQILCRDPSYWVDWQIIDGDIQVIRANPKECPQWAVGYRYQLNSDAWAFENDRHWIIVTPKERLFDKLYLTLKRGE